MAKRKQRKAKANTKARPKAKTKPARVAGATKAAVAGGPVTLAEAKALAHAKHPKQLAAKALVPPTATPATLGAERRRLEEARRREIERREREYAATIAIMKKRGARRPAPKALAGAPAAKAKGGGAFAPLQIFAEGDSWFDYPPFLFKGGVVPRLENRLGVPILNLAKAGDEVRYMLGVEQRKLLRKHLKKGCPAGGPWDVLLFSGGGNDITDNPMALWVRDWDPTVPPAKHVNQTRFDSALALVRAGYEDLISLRDEHSPTTHLVFHGYDFAIPDGRGICHLGPWLEPTFKLRGFPKDGVAAAAVVKEMLKQFAKLLTDLATKPKVTFVNGQGTLAPHPSSWHNELHPSRDGFEAFADLFRTALKGLFPDRVA